MKSLGKIELKPPAKTASARSSWKCAWRIRAESCLAERLHVFGLADLPGPFAGLLKNRGNDCDDDAPQLEATGRAAGPTRPTWPSSAMAPSRPRRLPPGPSRSISRGHQRRRLRQRPQLDRHGSPFLVPDRSGKTGDHRPVQAGTRPDRHRFPIGPSDYLKIETSLDGQAWQTVFEKAGITGLPGFGPTKTLKSRSRRAGRFVKVTVDPTNPPAASSSASTSSRSMPRAKDQPAALPQIDFKDGRPEICRPVRRTTLQVDRRAVARGRRRGSLGVAREEHRAR